MRQGRIWMATGLVLVVVLWGGYRAGAQFVLMGQPAAEVAAIGLVSAHVPPDALVAARVSGRIPLAKYSAIAHQMADWPVGSDPLVPLTLADLEAARAAGASFLLWDEATGTPPLPDPAAARVATTGQYTLYKLFEYANDFDNRHAW